MEGFVTMAGIPLRSLFSCGFFSCGLSMALAPWTVLASDSGCGPDAGKAESHEPAQAEEAPAGQTIYVDPVTGELTDPPVPAAPADAGQVQGPQPPEPDLNFVRLPDGTVGAEVGDRFVTELRIEVVDGKVVTCHRPVTPEPEKESRSGDDGEGDG